MSQAAVSLSEPLEAFVQDQVRSGAFPDRDAVIREAVSLLQDQAAEDAAKTVRLRTILADAAERLDRGQGHQVDDIDGYFDNIIKEATGA